MRFGTVCSGIESASCAFPSDWKLEWTSEINPFCAALIKERYPNATNLGDLTKISCVPACDLIVAGTPCQSFSVQGRGKGLDDARGQLAIQFTKLLSSSRPRWVIWENVPGVLRTNGGRDFGAFLKSLGQCGYGIAYRVLDARYFGSAARRRRVFVVGHFADWKRPAAVLFDGTQHRANAVEVEEIRQREFATTDGTESVLGWTGDETPKYGVEIAPTIRSQQGGEGIGVIRGRTIRRFTINELEQMQGLEHGYTHLPNASDAIRRTAIGNAFCANVLKWIANRIDAIDG